MKIIVIHSKFILNHLNLWTHPRTSKNRVIWQMRIIKMLIDGCAAVTVTRESVNVRCLFESFLWHFNILIIKITKLSKYTWLWANLSTSPYPVKVSKRLQNLLLLCQKIYYIKHICSIFYTLLLLLLSLSYLLSTHFLKFHMGSFGIKETLNCVLSV